MSVYSQMTNQPNRKCRPETILRLLMSTSYPQSTLSDLTLAFVTHGGQTDPLELEGCANDLREVEKAYTLTDFVRSIDIKRVHGNLKVIVKCLDLDPSIRTINDCSETHVELASSDVVLFNADLPLEEPEALAVRLLEMFYRSQVKNRRSNDTIGNTTWRYRSQTQERSKTKGKRPHVDVDVTVEQAIQKLASSLAKKQFHIVITQNTILLHDQKARLYGVSK